MLVAPKIGERSSIGAGNGLRAIGVGPAFCVADFDLISSDAIVSAKSQYRGIFVIATIPLHDCATAFDSPRNRFSSSSNKPPP